MQPSSLQHAAGLPKLIIFDLDGTLAESKAPLDAEMAALLGDLLTHKGQVHKGQVHKGQTQRQVAVISGASFAQFQTQFLAHFDVLENKAEAFANLSILPTSGSSFYKYDPVDPRGASTGGWVLVYQHNLSLEEKSRIKNALAVVAGDMHFEKTYGPQLEDRESQMTFSALGQQAPIEIKKDWDPDHKIRESMVARLRPMLPDFELNIGGMTTIDVTKKGIDKEYGVNALVEHFAVSKSDVVYVGDAIFPGGNDYAAVMAGLPTQPVKNVSETKSYIRSLLQSF